MTDLIIDSSDAVSEKFKNYPKEIRPKLKQLRDLIIETAEENEGILELEETLKWGEPSYLVKKGSTIRIDWKAKTPKRYSIYFKCTSKLVPTFKKLYGEKFNYEKNRAIWFDLDQEIPKSEIKECIDLALNYHKVKNKPLLGRGKT